MARIDAQVGDHFVKGEEGDEFDTYEAAWAAVVLELAELAVAFSVKDEAPAKDYIGFLVDAARADHSGPGTVSQKTRGGLTTTLQIV